MRTLHDLMVAILGFAALATSGAVAQDAAVSVERGAHIAIIGGCHDCHSTGYAQANGVVDPGTALKGDGVGFKGPWGTTYPANLRIIAGDMDEDAWVEYLTKLETRPPMPWFNVRQFSQDDMRSLYQYTVSLGEPGDPAPEYVPPDGEVKTPYIVFAPPQMPAGT